MENVISKTKKKVNIKKIIAVLGIAVLSFVLLLIFSIATSPLYNIYGYDSVEYKLAGAQILDGLVMFGDIFHQKGALFLFVETIGEALCRLFNDNRIGTFIIQFFNFFFSILTVYGCAQNYLQKKQCFKTKKTLLLSVLCISASVAVFWCGTLLYGNQVEEFAVLYQMTAVAICVKYCAQQNKENKMLYEFKPAYGFVLGICFAVTFWFKPTTAVIIGGCVLYVGLMLLIKKRFSCALKNIGMGLLGIAVVTVPILLYYYSKGALNDMLEQCFVFNLKYIEAQKGVTGWPLQLFAVYGIIIGFPVVSAILSVITKFKPICVFSFVISVVNLIMLLMTSISYIFYIEVEVSAFFVVLLCVCELKDIDLKGKSISIKAMGLVVLLSAALVFSGFQQIHRYSWLDEQEAFWQETEDKTQAFIEGTEYLIDKSNNKDILYITNEFVENRYMSYELRKYPFTNMFPLEFFDRVGTQEHIDAFYEDFEENPPRYIVIDNNRENINEVYDGVIQKSKEEYTAVYSDENYTLYELLG